MARGLSKVQKTRLKVLGTISCIIIVYFVVCFFSNVYTIVSLKNEKNKLESQLQELQEEAEYLKKDIEKLNDEEYLASYAREKYLYSKDGEYIIQLEDDMNETEDNISEIEKVLKSLENKTYIVLAIIILIILYLIFHSKSKKKNKK